MLQGTLRSTSGTSSVAMATDFIRIRDKDVRKVEMTSREQENERHCRTLDLQAMYDGFVTENSRATSDECH